MSGRFEPLTSSRRIGQFISVGAVGSVFDLTISIGLSASEILRPEVAKLIGAEVAIIVMFVINDRWTFATAGHERYWARIRRLIKSNIVRSVGLAIQVIVVSILTGWDYQIFVAGTDVWPIMVMPIAIGCAAGVNYLAESLITWRVLG